MTTHSRASVVIHLSNPFPPIPVRNFDWQAYFDDYDGAPDAGYQTTGSGPTPLAALIDFYENYESWFDEILCAHRPMLREDYECPTIPSR